MKIELLAEPELQFGSGCHLDVRFGLLRHGPLDLVEPSAPRTIRCGVVGTPDTVETLVTWLHRCRNEIPGKESPKTNLFPRFPGFNEDNSFRSQLVIEKRGQRTIPQRFFDGLPIQKDPNRAVAEAVAAFMDELTNLGEDATLDVVLVAPPMRVVDLMERDPESEEGDGAKHGAAIDFHDLLKAKAMSCRAPIQIVLPMTYDKTKRLRQRRRPERQRKLQDEATIAWNIHTALYYKAGGIPWRLIRDPGALTTCYVGVAFYQALEGRKLHTSLAEVFDELGHGLIVRGGPVELSKDDRQPHLTAEDAAKLLQEALGNYRRVHHNLPARVVLYKTSIHNDAELEGFREAVTALGIGGADFVSTGRFETRLFRDGSYPPLRGTLLSLDDVHHVLYTRGSVDFFETYPGMYVPRPFLLRCDDTESSPRVLAAETLALTKMNWNDTQFDHGSPIILAAARQVGRILRYASDQTVVASRYSPYM